MKMMDFSTLFLARAKQSWSDFLYSSEDAVEIVDEAQGSYDITKGKCVLIIGS